MHPEATQDVDERLHRLVTLRDQAIAAVAAHMKVAGEAQVEIDANLDYRLALQLEA